MSDLSLIPLQDGYESQLSQDWDGNTGTIYVLATPSYTPTTENTYIVVNPGKTNMQIAEITDYDSTAKTLTVSSISFEKGLGISSTAQSHSTGSKVIISDNYQFWEDIQTAVNSKLDITGGNGLVYATTAARDSALGADGVPTLPYQGIYVTATGLFYDYNLSSGMWESRDTGTTPGNATTTTAGLVRSDVAPAGIPVALITDNPKYDALAGTSGTPSTSNKYVTNDDTATAATADKIARRLAGGNITVVTESANNNSTNAASTAYVDTAVGTVPVNIDTLTFTRDSSTASGTQTVNHNLGRTPKGILFNAISPINITTSGLKYCNGGYDGTTNNCVTNCLTNESTSGVSDSYFFVAYESGTPKGYRGAVTAWDSTTFTVTWTKDSTPTGNIYIFAQLF